MRNKFLSRIIVVILLCAFLTMSVGRVTRVSAIGTTAVAVAGTATLAVGIVFLSYCALTGMATHCPDTMEGVRQWCTNIGNKVKQYPSGLEAYNEIYEGMYGHATGGTALLDDVWSWTREKLMAFANDFTNINTISDIVSYSVEVVGQPTNGFDYSSLIDIVDVPLQASFDSETPTFHSFEWWADNGYSLVPQAGVNMVFGGYSDSMYCVQPTNLDVLTYRNYFDGTRYGVQALIDDTWTFVNLEGQYGYYTYNNGRWWHASPTIDLEGYWLTLPQTYFNISADSRWTYPLLPNVAIYDSTIADYLPMDTVTDEDVERPHWPDVLDPDDEVEYPIVPYTQLPLDRYGGGGTPNPRWGFNLEDLLDILGELGRVIFDIQVLKELLNDFGGQSSGDSYIYYDYSENGTTYNNFEYYNTSNFYNDYVTYNIDVSEVDEHLPVDLNTIQQYTNNRYIESFKHSAIAGGSILRDLVVFWYDVDPEIVYVIFGTCIITLIAAFMGKWGHS